MTKLANLFRSVSFVGWSITMIGCSPSDRNFEQSNNAQFINEHESNPKALDDRYSTEAQVACSSGADDYLRSIALHDFKWDEDATGFMGIKFDKLSIDSAGSGFLTLVTTRAKLQNGFGAFDTIELFCLYDTRKNTVVRYSQSDPADDDVAPISNDKPAARPPEPIVIYTPPALQPSTSEQTNTGDINAADIGSTDDANNAL